MKHWRESGISFTDSDSKPCIPITLLTINDPEKPPPGLEIKKDQEAAYLVHFYDDPEKLSFKHEVKKSRGQFKLSG